MLSLMSKIQALLGGSSAIAGYRAVNFGFRAVNQEILFSEGPGGRCPRSGVQSRSGAAGSG